MLRMQFNGLGDAADYCTRITETMAEMSFCVDAFNRGVPFSDRQAVQIAMRGGGSTMPSSGGGFLPQPQPGAAPGGFVMPFQNPFAPTLMPGMPGYIAPGMPGYIAPVPWYAGPTGMLLLAGAALVAYKVFLAD